MESSTWWGSLVASFERQTVWRAGAVGTAVLLSEPAIGRSRGRRTEGSTPVEDDERYALFRAQIEHEDDLLGVRVGWLIASEAFLFAAYAAALVVPSVQHVDARFTAAARQLFTLLPALGIVISLLVLSSIVGGVVAAHVLDKKHGHVPEHLLPRLTGPCSTHLLGLASPLVIPLAIVIAWGSLLV